MGFFSWITTGAWNKPGADSPSTRAMRASAGYNGASGGRRMSGWNASILGPNSITVADSQQLLRRSRDAIRNSAIASSAIQRFESNIIGTGIAPHFTHIDPDIRSNIQNAFDKWAKQADFAGQLSFYGLQSLLARSLFEAGECFVRFHTVDEDDAYFQLQLIESEQVPVYVNTMQSGLGDNTVIREGIIFDQRTDKRVGYRIYRGQPYDTMVNSIAGSQFITLSTDEMLHVMKPLRPGALRGVPMMASVLPLLYDIEGYADSERLRKRLASMFAFFITKESVEDAVVPITNEQVSTDPGVDITKLEPGTMQELLPGESIVTPTVPESLDYAGFMAVELRKFASGVNLTYEMVTSDYTKVNYSSARVALLEFRRSAEQFQKHIIVNQFCAPILKRWMQEAVLAGALDLPNDFLTDPGVYEACAWVGDGFGWTDPLKEVQAAQMSVRSGFTSRSMIIRQNGFDPATVDAEIAIERAREQELGIITDTNANVILLGKETQPLTVTEPDPSAESNQEASQDTDSGG